MMFIFCVGIFSRDPEMIEGLQLGSEARNGVYYNA